MSNLCALCILAMLAPGSVLAEGAARDVDCKVARSCDAAGDCTMSDDHIRFRLEPENVGPDGIGTYIMSYGEISVGASKVAPPGPILWRESGEDLQSLIRDGPTGMIWHRFTPGEKPSLKVIFLTCEVIG